MEAVQRGLRDTIDEAESCAAGLEGLRYISLCLLTFMASFSTRANISFKSVESRDGRAESRLDECDLLVNKRLVVTGE